ncbi:calcium uptake protein 1 homolog, mitochondrial isoform X2 [Drosophila pseudoobscura]|uniref:Calcium uptake protein 1 homolog, mitochondrial isoform X2 n=1 Tax=Drosophila pseudoobscura pseudoobscura TaxID=46245 RepID=A0A6I8V7T9_DROPS|nr:calcium uptake protein 1 homolog, mitochondrial isoform X2 [Drosophila pseudoobscura]
MSVLRFLVTRQALAALSRPTSINLLQNRAQVALASTLASNSTNSCLKAATTICDGNPCQMQIRGHKRFGHQQEKTPQVTKYFHGLILSLFIISVLDWGKVKRLLMPKVDADYGQRPSSAAGVNGEDSSDDSESDDSDEDESSGGLHLHEGKKIREKVGFRERKIIEYENRIRQFSTPDKIFRYFATVRLQDATQTIVCMTPEDFLRSIYPGIKQPDGLGLDQYRRYDPKSVGEQLNLHLEKNSIFYKLGSYGLITFSDYIFLLTVLSISRRHFEIAFRMFDLNGDGDVDCEEFEMVATLVRSQTSMGTRHRDHANTGNTFKSLKGVNSALITYFFGPNMDEKLTIEKFLDFQEQLQREILSLEFERKEPNDDGNITEADFAELLLAYAGYPLKKKQKKLKRVKRRFRDHGTGISKQDYLDFFHFLNNINDVDTALTFYHIAGASIDQQTLQHVAKTVALVNLSDHVVDVVFTIFDENNDNQLSNKEFISVMKNRVQRGLEKPKDTGFLKMMRSVFKCAKETKPVLLDI